MYSKNGLPDVTDAITDRALAPSRPALTTDPVMASLFQGLNDGRNVRFRLGLGIGDMPRLQHQAGTVLAYHRLFRRHVHGMAAATQQSGSRICSSLNLLMVLLCEVFEKIHGGRVGNNELRVITGSEHPPPALRIDSLNGQHHGKNVFATLIRDIIRHSNT